MKKIIYMAAAAALVLSSCHKDKGEDNSLNLTPAEQPSGKGDVTESLGNAEAQKKLEGYASEFVDAFKPEDQKTAIETLNKFISLMDDLGSPDRWNKDDKDLKKNFVAEYAQNVAVALSKKDYSKSTTVNEEFFFDFDEYAGIYTEENDSWTYAEASNVIVFKFKSEGIDCEFKAEKGSGKVSEQFDNGDEILKIGAPAGVTITCNYGGEELVKTVANVKYDSRKSLQATVSCKVANLEVKSITSITNDKISDTQTVAIDGNTLLWTEVYANGNHFTDVSHFEERVGEREEDEDEELDEESDDEDVEEDDDDDPRDYLTSAGGKLNVMGNVQVTYELKLDSYFDNLDAFECDGDDEQAVKDYCNAWNKTFTIGFYYSGSDVQQGTMKLQPKVDEEWNGRKTWDIQPVIEFAADGTSFAFEDYFNEDKFADTESQFESLFDKYEEYWD